MDCEKQQTAGAIRIAMNDHFAGVKYDLSHVQSLLSEAITGLFEEVRAISDACHRQQMILGGVNTPEAAQLMADNHMMEKSAKELVVHLQFQDMVNQLLDHAMGRLNAIESLGFFCDDKSTGNLKTSRSDSFSDNIPRRSPEDGMTLALAGASRMMHNKPVKAQDMSAGDIELF